jgi:hypothetical protein
MSKPESNGEDLSSTWKHRLEEDGEGPGLVGGRLATAAHWQRHLLCCVAAAAHGSLPCTLRSAQVTN